MMWGAEVGGRFWWTEDGRHEPNALPSMFEVVPVSPWLARMNPMGMAAMGMGMAAMMSAAKGLGSEQVQATLEPFWQEWQRTMKTKTARQASGGIEIAV